VRCAGHAPAKLSAAAKALRHRARQAYGGETPPRSAVMHLDAIAEGMRASDARQCRICCYLTKSEKEEGGLQSLFDRAALGGKKRRSARRHRGRYPARVAAHLSLSSNIISVDGSLERDHPRAKDAQPAHRQRWDVRGTSRTVGSAAPVSSARCRTKSGRDGCRGTAKRTAAIFTCHELTLRGA